MAAVPAFNLECHHSLSIPAYDALYPSDDFGRAFSVPVLSEDSESAKWIERTETSLSSLTQVLDLLQIAVKQLQEHRGRLQIHVNKQKTYGHSSPIRRLPPEILSLIFSHACQSFEHKLYLTPLSISVTCFRWRSIAISTPVLWTNIFVGPVGTYNGAEGAERLSLYMSRAKGLPISLKWITDRGEWSDGDDDDDDDDEHNSIIDAVMSTYESWKNIEFILDEIDMFEAYASLVSIVSDISLLEHASLRVNGSPSRTRLPLFLRAPKLRTLSLHTPEFPFWSTRHIPWPQIETLTLDAWDPPNTGPFLLDYGFVEGNRKTLIVNGDLPLVTPGPSTQWLTRLVLQLPHLDDTRLISHLSSISLPVLEELELHNQHPPHCCGYYHTREQTATPRGILQLLTESKCSLRVLKIIGLGVNSGGGEGLWEELLACLALTPALTCLFIVENGRNTHLAAPLFSSIISQKHLPKLTSLGLVWNNPGLLPVDELIQLLESRTGMEKTSGLVNLSSVVIGLTRGEEVQPRILDAMKALRCRGVQTSLW